MIIRMTLELCRVDSAVDSGVTEAVVPMLIRWMLTTVMPTLVMPSLVMPTSGTTNHSEANHAERRLLDHGYPLIGAALQSWVGSDGRLRDTHMSRSAGFRAFPRKTCDQPHLSQTLNPLFRPPRPFTKTQFSSQLRSSLALET